MVAKSFLRWVRHPSFWFIAQGIALAIFLAATSQLRPHATPDTPSYQRFPLDSLHAAFEHSRTFGYPIFLRLAGSLAEHSAAVPACQLAIHCGLYFPRPVLLHTWSGRLICFLYSCSQFWGPVCIGCVREKCHTVALKYTGWVPSWPLADWSHCLPIVHCVGGWLGTLLW